MQGWHKAPFETSYGLHWKWLDSFWTDYNQIFYIDFTTMNRNDKQGSDIYLTVFRMGARPGAHFQLFGVNMFSH